MAMAGGMPAGGLQAIMASIPNWQHYAGGAGGMPTPAQARAAGVVGSTARPGTTAASAQRPATPDQLALQQSLMTGVAGFTPWQQQTQQQVWNFAQQPLSGAYSQAATAARYGVQNPLGDYDTIARTRAQQVGQNPLAGFGGQAAGYINQAASQPGGAQTGMSNNYLQAATSGQYLTPGSNPYLSQMVQNAQGDTANTFNTKTLPAIAAQFAASGQFGSDQQRKAMVDAGSQLQKNLGDMATSAYGNAYSQERGLQQQAAGQLGAQGLQQSGMQLQAGAQLGNLGQAMDASRLNAGQLALGTGQAVNSAKMGAAAFGIDAANAQRQAQMQNFGLMAGVGDAQQGLNQRYADMLQSQWMQSQQMPWQNLQQYGNLVYGNPATSATTQTQQGGGGGGNALSGALGGGLALYGLGSGYGWWGK